MGYQTIKVVDSAVDTATLVTTAETVVGSIVMPTNLQRDTPVDIEASVSMTTGTLTTAVQIRIRRDSLSGALVDVLKTVQVGASLPTGLEHTVRDPVQGEIANRTYVVTAQQVGANGNGSVQGVTLIATATP